jgi:hypothetical protein
MRKALMALVPAAALGALAFAAQAQAPAYYAPAPASGYVVESPVGGYVHAAPGPIEPPPGAFFQSLAAMIGGPFTVLLTPSEEILTPSAP